MIPIILPLIIILHGLIHLPGFLRAFGIMEFPDIQGNTLINLSASATKFVGILWLVTCILLVTAGIIFLLKIEEWWMIGLPGLILSQALIILYWHDAKYGTIANVILIIALMLAYGIWQFKNSAEKEKQILLENASANTEIVTPDRVNDLPPVIQKWLNNTKINVKNAPKKVHLHQKGEMLTEPDGKWMPFTAEQYFTIDPPGFLWLAHVEAAPFITLTGMDKFRNGKGQMVIKLFSLIPVANGQGPTIDQGTLVRYLAEIVWFPTAALQDYIKWEQLDKHTAKATIQYKGVSAEGIFSFDIQGNILSFEAQRYYDRKEGATLETWFVKVNKESYKNFEGHRLPTKSEVTWKLDEGDFTWLKLEITDLKYN